MYYELCTNTEPLVCSLSLGEGVQKKNPRTIVIPFLLRAQSTWVLNSLCRDSRLHVSLLDIQTIQSRETVATHGNSTSYFQNLSLTPFYVSTKKKSPTCVANLAKAFPGKNNNHVFLQFPTRFKRPI
jgi:hypothetical protein